MEEKNKNKAIKKSSKKLKRVMIVTTITMACVMIFAGIFGIAGEITNQRMNKENLAKINQFQQVQMDNASILAEKTEQQFKKETFERELYTNDRYFDTQSTNIYDGFFNYLNREEYRNTNVFYNLIENKTLKVYIDPSISNEKKELIREAINYLHVVCHTIDPNITISETNSLIHSPTCFHITEDETNIKPNDSAIAETTIQYEGDSNFDDAIRINIFSSKMSSYEHNAELFAAAYKTVAMHELCHALGITHIPEMLDESGRFGSSVRYNELNRPLMSISIKATPGDRLCPSEIAGLFGLINNNTYNDLKSQDKTAYQARLNSDYQKFLNLIGYSLNQSRGYKLTDISKDSFIEYDQVIQLSYEDNLLNKNTNNKEECEVYLTLNYPYVGYYQKEICFENGDKHTFFAPFFTTKDSEGNCKFSLMAEDWKKFDNCNIYVNGKSSSVVAYDLTAQEVEQKVKELDPNLGYYVLENGSNDLTTIFRTQNFWQQISKKHQDNVIRYNEPLFTLYQTSPRWIIQKTDGNSTSAIELTNELDSQSEFGN